MESAEDPHLLLSPIVQWDELTGRSDDTGPKDEMSLGMTESVEDEKTQRLRYLTKVETVKVHSNLIKRLFTGSQVISELHLQFLWSICQC